MDNIDVAHALSCCFCDSHLRVPLLLNCFHNICAKCAASSQEITCPTCREATPFGDITVNSFSIISQRVSRMTYGHETCEWCSQENEKNLADWWCEECSQAMCDQCLKLHNLEFDTESDQVPEWCDTIVNVEVPQSNVQDASNNVDEAFNDACSESSSEMSDEYNVHAITSLVDALQNEYSTFWHVQRRCGVHRMKSFYFCFQCNTMKCKKCLNDCLDEGHKTCTAKDKQTVAFTEVFKFEAEKALETLVDLFKQQHDVTWLRHIQAIRSCVDALLQKKKAIINAVRRAYSEALKPLDTYLETVCKERRAAQSQASRVGQAIRYGNVLLENTHINASRYQWQMLLPRIRTLTNKEHQLLRKHSTSILPVVEKCDLSEVDELCHDWFRSNVPPIGDELQTKSDEEHVYDSEAVKESHEGQVNVGAESNVSESSSPGSELPEYDMDRLISIITSEMNKIAEKHGKFAYYFGKNMEVEAYTTSDTRCSTDMLQAELETFLRSHISEQHVRVTVREHAPVAVFCCGGIGSLLTVGRMEQVVGIYLQYQARGTIYWISAAHGLVKCSPESLPPNQPTHCLDTRVVTSSMHVRNHPKITARFSPCPDLPMVDISVPYVALSYNPLALRDKQQGILCHSVDIMMGPTPLTNWHVSNYLPCKSSFISALDGCCQPLCCALHHTRGRPLYTISSIRYFVPLTDRGCTTFLMQSLVGKILYCYLGDERQLATGRVNSVYNCTPTMITNQASVCMAQNMFCITPTGSFRPAEGHSGSVWVMQCDRSGRYEAIAITCAVVLPPHQHSTLESNSCEAWLASPLCACLLALSEEYPERFGDYRQFTVPD